MKDRLATAPQKARILALVGRRGRTLGDVLAMAQHYGLGQGDIETLTKVEALKVIAILLRVPEVECAVNASPIDRTSEYDRLWFEKHPGEDKRVRHYIPGEFSPMEAEDTGLADETAWVEVAQAVPGVRVRRLLTPSTIVYWS